MGLDTGKKVGTGILASFVILLGIVVIVGGIYLTIYINSIILGSIFQVSQDSNVTTDVINTSFIARNDTVVSLPGQQIRAHTLVIKNLSNGYDWGLSNFSINYSLGSLQIVAGLGGGFNLPRNGTRLVANYTYVTTTEVTYISDDTKDFLGTTESSFFDSNNSLLSAITFATSLIPIAVILLVLGGAIVGGYAGYKYMKKKRGMGGSGDLGY